MLVRRFFIFLFLLLFSSAFWLQQPDLIPEPKSRLLVPADQLAEYPDIAIDAKGTIWIVYMQMIDRQEQIVLRALRGGTWADSLILDHAGLAYRPRIAMAPNGTIWTSWARGEKGKTSVFAMPVANGQKGRMEMVSADQETANWQQEMTFDASGRLWLAWERMNGDTSQIMYSVRENDRWRKPQTVFAAPHRQMRPALAAGPKGEVWCAWDGYLGNYNYDIFLRRLDKETPIWNVTNSPTLEQCPALDVDANNRLWLAWHSNADQNGKPDIPRWLALRHWDGKQLFAPAAEMPDKNLAAREMLQSWEFPALLASRSGTIWLFGRPSQEFSAQVFLGERWSRRKNFALAGWGGRGELVRAAEAPDGTIWTVRRDIAAIELCGFAARKENPAKPNFQLAPEQPVSAIPTAAATRTKWTINPEEKNFIGGANESLVFGDLHQHSNLSDGMGTVDDCYTRSRDFYNWDFAALTDHEWFVRNRLLPSEWEYIKKVTASFHAPGDFITIPAYEWTSARWPNGVGHKNVYFPDESKPIYSLADTFANVTPKLFARLKTDGAIAFPHHIGWTGVDWQNHDPVAQPNVEIVSVHGAYEYLGNEPITHRGGMPGMFMQNGLAQGLHFGVLGASDGHGLIWHHGIGRKRDPWVQGLAGVWINGALTREAIFEALKARRLYATSGVRIMLYISADGHPMGSEYAANAPPKLVVRVVCTDKIHYVYLLRDNEVIHQFGGDFGHGEMSRFEFIDQQASPGTHWYYVRVIQEDGEMAWSSPIWVKLEK